VGGPTISDKLCFRVHPKTTQYLSFPSKIFQTLKHQTLPHLHCFLLDILVIEIFFHCIRIHTPLASTRSISKLSHAIILHRLAYSRFSRNHLLANPFILGPSFPWRRTRISIDKNLSSLINACYSRLAWSVIS
jgi:hypothetical protein